MAIGVVNDSDFETELSKATPNNGTKQNHTIQGQIEDQEIKGRVEGTKEVPESLRKIIGETSVISGRADALKLSEMFGVSHSSTSAYANGATSTKTYDTPNTELVNHINKKKARVGTKAHRVLMNALNNITTDKLEGTKAVELSQIAKNMSSIVLDMEPTKSGNGEGEEKKPFILYAPTFVKEERFEIINLNE